MHKANTHTQNMKIQSKNNTSTKDQLNIKI